ncbi:MAG: alpha/beta hydrolase [Lentimonas sp.]
MQCAEYVIKSEIGVQPVTCDEDLNPFSVRGLYDWRDELAADDSPGYAVWREGTRGATKYIRIQEPCPRHSCRHSEPSLDSLFNDTTRMKAATCIQVLLLLLTSALVGNSTLNGAQNYPPVIKGAEEIIYKTVDGIDLKLWIFRPEGDRAEAAPAMIFFFGGGWKNGSPKAFVSQAQYLAQRGMYGVVADYRVASRHGVKANSCVEDARDALHYIKAHADRLQMDPDRIGVGGGSAGGHLAACLGTLYAKDDAAPNALALYNPATILAPIEIKTAHSAHSPKLIIKANLMLKFRQSELRNRLGVTPSELSPFHHISERTPPTIIFHGTKDTTIPFLSAALFAEQLQAYKVNMVMKSYEGSGHGFFNREPERSQTNAELDQFLFSLGWLEAK